MTTEQKTLAKIKNFENQIRLFLYDNAYIFETPNSLLPAFNLLSNVTPIKFLFKELMLTADEDREEELKFLIVDYLSLIEKDFRSLARRTPRLENVQDVWFSLYEVYLELQDWMPDHLGDWEIREFKQFNVS